VIFAGTPRGLESRLVPKAGYGLELLPILPLNGAGPLRGPGGPAAPPGVLTGNPGRGGSAGRPEKPPRPPLTLLAFGGSQGSRVLNRALVAALPRLPGPDALRIVHQTGPAMQAGRGAANR